MRQLAVLVLLAIATIGVAADVTPEQARDLQTKFKAEREVAAKQFAVPSLERADRMAARAEQALTNGELRNAADGFRDARWLLPVMTAGVPANVSRVFGAPRLRHRDVIL